VPANLALRMSNVLSHTLCAAFVVVVRVSSSTASATAVVQQAGGMCSGPLWWGVQSGVCALLVVVGTVFGWRGCVYASYICRVEGLKPASTCLWTVPRAQAALLRGRAWVAQSWATCHIGWGLGRSVYGPYHPPRELNLSLSHSFFHILEYSL